MLTIIISGCIPESVQKYLFLSFSQSICKYVYLLFLGDILKKFFFFQKVLCIDANTYFKIFNFSIGTFGVKFERNVCIFLILFHWESGEMVHLQL